MSMDLANQNRVKQSPTETIRQLADAGKQLFDAGKQVADSLSELSRRLEQVGNVGSSLTKTPWVLAGIALVAGALILSRAGRHS